MVEKKKFERLPTILKPHVYDLFIKVDFGDFKFSGREVISLKVLQPTDKILLNSKELIIHSVELKVQPNDKILTPKFSLNPEVETLELFLSEKLPVGLADLTIEFAGELNQKMVGFYRSKYIKVTGEEESYFAVTQFEASEARRCFPCWDEPAIKAKFDISLSVESGKIALSNMPVEKESPDEDGHKVVKFARTPVMSTYLVAFVIGDFDYVEETSSDGVLVRVYTPPGKKDQGKFALYVATRILSFYNDYFKIPYPLPKMDLVAVSEMSCGAMENWGLVTYQETYLLVDEKNSSAATKQGVAVVVGHELAHQWFGNLVTMEWWTHLWLNEGYASFVQYLCVDYLFPEYDIWTQFVTDMHCRALELDALKNSHPIEVPVGHPSEVDEIFDDISYNKGSSVIRMLHRYIGDEDFRKGMNLYLTRHQYGNSFTEDLWAALEEASKKPISEVMPKWTKQVGFPVITVESCEQQGDTRTLILSQYKFCAEANQIGNDSSLWLVPVSFCTKSNPDKECFSTTIKDRQCKVTIPNVKAGDWIKLNQGTVGFFRTKYTPTWIQQFIPSIEDKTLPPLDRLGILDDLFALVQVGQASTIQAIDLIWAMRNEDNYTVWTNILTCLEKLQNLLIDNERSLEIFDYFGRKVMAPIYKKLGHENKPDDSHLTKLLRSSVLNRLVRFGETSFEEIVNFNFEKHIAGERKIPADQRSFIYRAVLTVGGKNKRKAALDNLIKLYRDTDLQEEKDRILRAFSAIIDVNLIDDILQFAQSDDINLPSMVTAIISAAASKVGRVKTFEFVKGNYEKLYGKYTDGCIMSRIIKCTTENFASMEAATEIENFFANKRINGIERTIQQSLETIRNNAAWLGRDGEIIERHIKSNELLYS